MFLRLWYWDGGVFTPPDVFSGGNARIGGTPVIDALERIGLTGAGKDGGAIGGGVHTQAARIGGSPDVATPGRIGGGSAKGKPGRIG